jgi:hypothetical protein
VNAVYEGMKSDTSRLMRRTKPADSAMKTEVRGEAGSEMAARILDFMDRGSPFLLSDLAAFR